MVHAEVPKHAGHPGAGNAAGTAVGFIKGLVQCADGTMHVWLWVQISRNLLMLGCGLVPSAKMTSTKRHRHTGMDDIAGFVTCSRLSGSALRSPRAESSECSSADISNECYNDG